MKKILFVFIPILCFGQINWENEIVDSCDYGSHSYKFNIIALDTNNIPYIIYNKYAEVFKIIFASRSDSGWQKEVVDSGLFYYGFSLIFDDNNIAHLSYYRKDDSLNKTYICYARREDTGWITEVVDSKMGSLGNWFWHYNSSIDLDTSGLPGIAYVAWNIEDSIQYIKYAHYNDTGWDTSIVEYDSLWTGWGPSDWCPSLKFDSNNRSHIALYQCSWGANDSLKYYYCDNLNNWIIDWVTYLGPAGGTFSLELALSSEGYPNIAYDYDGSLAYTWWDGISWHTDYIILVGWDGVDIHLDVDSFDRPHIAYLPDQNGRPYYCYKDSIWHLCGPIEPDTSFKTFQVDISFALDDNDRPCVSYPFYKYVGWSIFGLKYAKGTFVGIEEASSKIPEPGYALQVYPNPVQGVLNIRYTVYTQSATELSLYDVTGSRIKVLKQEKALPGYYQEKIDVSKLSNGVYFIILRQGDEKTSKKLVLVR